jgi:hypothetical protein
MIQSAVADPKRGWRWVADEVPTDAWATYRETLAQDGSLDFRKLVAAYLGIQGIQSMSALGEPDPRFVPEALDALAQAADYLNERELGRRLPPGSPSETGG